MIETIAFFLVVSLVLYALLGGADFGAGVVEIALGARGEDEVTHALAPVWEVNHIWLILALVVSFVAFPEQHAYLVTAFHVPVTLLLVCIVVRGTAFTFRHYDPTAQATGSTRSLYTYAFRFASVLASMLIGCIAASLWNPHPLLRADSFAERYLNSWMSTRSLLCGIFVTSLFALTATTFLAAEGARKEKRLRYLKLGRRLQWVTVGLGLALLVLSSDALSTWQSLARESLMLTGFGYGSMILATFAIPALAWAFHRGNATFARLAVSAQVLSIVLGWLSVVHAMRIAHSGNTAMDVTRFAGASTLQPLVVALVIGVCLIAPSCGWLFLVFKAQRPT